MALNPFIGWSREELERALRLAQDDYAAGASIESAGSGDVNSRNRFDSTPRQRIINIYAALYRIAPDEYSLDQIAPITQTKITFAQADYGGTSVSTN